MVYTSIVYKYTCLFFIDVCIHLRVGCKRSVLIDKFNAIVLTMFYPILFSHVWKGGIISINNRWMHVCFYPVTKSSSWTSFVCCFCAYRIIHESAMFLFLLFFFSSSILSLPRILNIERVTFPSMTEKRVLSIWTTTLERLSAFTFIS